MRGSIMYLYNVKLWNFRKYGANGEFNLEKPDLNINFKRGLNLLIGENDSGKTAIIDAIKIVLKTTSYEWIRITHDDFYKDSDRLRIALKFIDFEVEEAKNFVEFLSWEVIDNKNEPVLNLIYDVSRKEDKIIPSDVKADIKKYLKVWNCHY